MAIPSRYARAGAVIAAGFALFLVTPAAADDDDDIVTCLKESGGDDAIIAACTRVLGKGAPDGPLLMNRGRAYGRKGQYDRAVQDFTQLIALDRNNHDAWTARCWVRMLAGQGQQAVTDCTEALRLSADDDNSLFARAVAYFKLGQYDKAIADYNAVIKLQPDNAAPLYGRGLAKVKKGDTASGNADIAKAKTMQADIAEDFTSQLGIAAEQASTQIPNPSPSPNPNPSPSPNPGPRLHESTFQRSCSAIHFALSNGNPAVQANCKRINGTSKTSTLVLRGISNEDGKLVQGSGVSSFHRSCTTIAISVVGQAVVLAAQCRPVNGAAVSAVLALDGIDNINGDLKYQDPSP